MEIQFTTEHFTRHLTNLGLGMLAIIIVIGTIILVTMALNAATKKKMSKSTTALVSVLAIAILGGLLAGLYFADGSCASCLKKGEHSVNGVLYCEAHYDEYMESACVKCDQPGDHEIGGVKFCEKHFNMMLGLNCDSPECDKKHTHRVEIAPNTDVFAQFCDEHYEEYLKSLNEAE